MCNKLTSITIGNAVTSIGENAFSGCNSLETITIPDNVTSIRNAFRECESLTSIVIGNGVKEIVYAAFYKCKKLTDITIGIGVTTIGDSAFGGCGNIKNVYISDLSAWLKIDFKEDVETYATNPLRSGGKLFLNNELLTELRVPDDITKINHGAFYRCSSLKQVIIHDKVTEVGEAAFKDCSSLEKIILGKGMKTIHSRAFQTKSLKECYSYSTTPPEIKGTGSIYYESFSSEANATLYVPAKCGTKYNVGGWKVFKNIIEMD